ncbi:DUF1993 domain-containing protein [Alteraurantiacibacter aquimixticola]|uniref:DUF1993 domain-containing protein n=1 Tax=Alteraurantiacibacter aquimixticola TaxID=2489173 RepID=A0A4V6UGC1_9SPHN|nr:DUF1993 domain-containing protein [Alteraurantiacibacter aquimixticola]TIX51467.1 DUF1993 domain-containing protein [Alteraurantiacibacter aquimixticola]
MPVSLHAATIPSMLQMIGAAKGWLDKAEDSDLSEEEIASACLIEDMLPFAYQVKSIAVHSQGAIEGVRKGVFSPDRSEPAETLEGMRERLEEARAFLSALTEAELEGFIGQDMRFEIGDKRLDFTAEDFLLSFSQPNFYFHATAAYAILRHKGVPVGKIDYLGRMRLKT